MFGKLIMVITLIIKFNYRPLGTYTTFCFNVDHDVDQIS